MSKKLHYYTVTGKLLGTTKEWGVIATTPEVASSQIRANCPGVDIYNILYRGPVDSFHEVLDDIELMKSIDE